MRTYVEFAIKKFQNKMAYRLEFFMGIVNTIITIVVYLCIYKALYEGKAEVDGISYAMTATSFVISLGLSNAFHFNEMFIQDKIHDGSITNEFLKPVNFVFRLLWENIGEGLFRVVFNFLPAVVFAYFYTDLCAPYSMGNFIIMLISVALGYLVLWLLSLIIQVLSFWLFSVWGIMTIKNVIVNILSGVFLPLWFMPDIIKKIIVFTPFESIYFTPIRIYLGEVTGMEMLSKLSLQLMWIGILGGMAGVLWSKGVKKLVVQGG